MYIILKRCSVQPHQHVSVTVFRHQSCPHRTPLGVIQEWKPDHCCVRVFVSLFLLCADRQQSCDHHRSYQHPAVGVNVVWLWVFLLLYLAAPAGSSAKQSEQASIIKSEAHVLLHSSEERIHSVGKVPQFWVNPVLIVNCTFWKNIWQVSVFLFVISTQQSVPKISWFVQVMSDHVTSFSPFSSPIADVSPVRDGASWQPGGSQRADPARRPAGGGGGSAGRRSTAPRPGPDPEKSWEHTEAEHHSSTPYEKTQIH